MISFFLRVLMSVRHLYEDSVKKLSCHILAGKLEVHLLVNISRLNKCFIKMLDVIYSYEEHTAFLR